MSLIKRIQMLEPNQQRVEDVFTLLVGGDGDANDLRWVRRNGRRLGMYDLLKRTYIYGARQGSFDDYMIACEWDREPNARFWLPRRAVLEGKHGIATKIQQFIEDEEARYLGFSMPPGTGKSTLIKFLLAFIAGEFPRSANMYVSYSDGMIKMMYDSVSAIMTDKTEYNHGLVFDNGVPDLSAEYKTISHRKKGDFPTIGMVAMGGSVTGRTRANKFLVTDDLVKNAEVARSPERLNKLYEDYKSTLTTRMIGDDVKEIQLGTIWSAHDPISRRKRDLDSGDRRNWFITLPVKDEDGHSNFDYDHPDHYSDEKIAELEESLDSVTFACLYMQNGIEREGLAFPSDELRYYNGVLPDGEPDGIKAFTDVAWGGGDRLAMPIGYIYGDDVYIEDVIFDKGDKSVTKPRVKGKIIAHGVRAARFEANNGGDEYADSISDMLKEERYTCNITHKKAPGNMSKLSRIEQYSPDIKRNFIFRSKGHRSPEYDKFMEEVCTLSFTSKNLHDDAPDSLAGLADFVNRGVKQIGVFKRPF